MSAGRPPSDIGRGDRVAVWIILIVGSFGGGVTAGLGIITGIFRLFDPARYPITLLADIPVQAGPGIVQAHGDSIVVHTDRLSGGPLWALATADVVAGIALGLVTASFAYVLSRVVGGKPFHRSMRAAALIAGSAIVFGSLVAQGVRGLGTMMAATELSDALGGVAEPAFLFEPLPIVVGFGVLALAYVFQTGTRLQRETEGLV